MTFINDTLYLINISTEAPWIPGVKLWFPRDALPGIYITFSIIGVPLNLWFLAAILSCPKLRASLRNSLISGLLFAHLLDTAILLPLLVWLERETRLECEWRRTFWNMCMIQDATANWTIVLLLTVVLTKISECDITCYLSRCRMLLLLLPWIFSIITITLLTWIFTDTFCVTEDDYYNYMVVFDLLACIIPVIVAIFLLVMMLVQKSRHLSSRSSPGLPQSELIGSNTEISLRSYLVMVAMAVVCDIPIMWYYYELPFKNNSSRGYFYFPTFIMTHIRSVVMPLVFFLLPDIWDRLKIWRPWRCTYYNDPYAVEYWYQHA